MRAMRDQIIELAETASERSLLKRWLGVEDEEFTARSRAWHVVESRRAAQHTMRDVADERVLAVA